MDRPHCAYCRWSAIKAALYGRIRYLCLRREEEMTSSAAAQAERCAHFAPRGGTPPR